MIKEAKKGFTLIELVVAVGLFALVMTLAAGSYLVIIGVYRQVQGISTGIDNVAFALETMTRSIRTGTDYNCGSPTGGSCSGGAGSFYFADSSGRQVSYTLSGGTIYRNVDTVASAVTDPPPSVTITSLRFYVFGADSTDDTQSRVTMLVSGEISAGPGKTEYFTVETGATMRGTDI